MKHLKPTLIALAAVIALAGAGVAQADDFTLEGDNTFNSKYVWRGINLNDDWVYQLSATAGYKWVTFNVWSNVELTDENDYGGKYGSGEGEITEVDYTADISYSFDKLTLSTGAVHYTFPNTPFDSTTEVYGGLGPDVIGLPTITVNHDVDEAGGVYGAFSLGHTFENIVILSESSRLGFDVSASVAAASERYNEFYFGLDEAALTDVSFYGGIPLSVGPHLSITPAANYSTLIDDELRDSTDDEDNFWWGVSLTASL